MLGTIFSTTFLYNFNLLFPYTIITIISLYLLLIYKIWFLTLSFRHVTTAIKNETCKRDRTAVNKMCKKKKQKKENLESIIMNPRETRLVSISNSRRE